MKKLLKKAFVPHEHNGHHPYLLRGKAFGAIIAIALLVCAAGFAEKFIVGRDNGLAAIYGKVLVALANEDREEENLGELTVNPLLVEAARLKAEDMAEKGYFAHYGPDKTAPWDWMKKAGYEYSVAGENLAINFSDSKDVNKAWMRSPTHKANILNDDFTEVGIATARGMYEGKETVFVVQMFGKPKAKPHPKPEPVPVPTRALAQAVPVDMPDQEPEPVQELNIAPETAAEAESQPEPEMAKIAAVEPSQSEFGTTSPIAQVQGVSVGEASLAEVAVANPRSVGMIVFGILIILEMIALVSMVVVECEKKDMKHALYSVMLLMLLGVMVYGYNIMVAGEVVIG